MGGGGSGYNSFGGGDSFGGGYDSQYASGGSFLQLNSQDARDTHKGGGATGAAGGVAGGSSKTSGGARLRGFRLHLGSGGSGARRGRGRRERRLQGH